jgi:hypothetical protein
MTDKRIFVFDIDGTLANIEHRRQYVQNGQRNWKKFNEKMMDDTPYEDIIFLAQHFHSMPWATVLIASGRGAEDREKTENWLSWRAVPYTKLYMRPAKDSRKDSIIKKEILEQIRAEYGEPFMVFDDRNQVVDMWRENGVRCLQVAPGNF